MTLNTRAHGGGGAQQITHTLHALARTRAGGGVYVQGLRREPVASLAQCRALLQAADESRAVGATQLNARSSRSHACYVVHVERRDPGACRQL